MPISSTLTLASRSLRLSVLAVAAILAATLLFATSGIASAQEESPGGSAQPQPQPPTQATQLVDRFLDILSLPDGDKVAALESFLALEFQLVRANGARLGKGEYLANPSSVDVYEINDLVATEADDLIVVSYTLFVTATIDGVEQTTMAPRLSVFHRNDGQWQLAAHSNFGAIDPS